MSGLDADAQAYLDRLLDEAPPLTPEAAAVVVHLFADRPYPVTQPLAA